LGRSVHSVQSAVDAQADGADFLLMGTIFPSHSHPEGEPVGPDLLRLAQRTVVIPILGIGGITRGNIALVMDVGASVHHSVTHIEGNHLPLAHVAGGIGHTCDHRDPKALAMEALCRRRGYASLRFDYQGRSGSSGDYDDGTLGTRLDDALSVIDEFTEGPLVLVGYSMGGWLAFLAALRRTERLAGLMGIAPGIDFVDWINDKLSSEENVALHRDGRVVRTSPDYPGETWITTLALIEDAENHRLLTGPIEIDCPVRLIHGLADPDAPWEVSPRTAEQLTSADVEVILLKDAGHILRSDREVERFMDVFGELLDAVAQ
jgi:pimeloyl-ACP methyl ester carboxylesterase